tara:strand:+ start:40 stop:318 length:279 start_codon:yes stop_codon:yes gene_type:complete
MNLRICFFYDRDPNLIQVLAATKHRESFDVYWNSVINYYVNPLKVLENSNNVEPYTSELMEDWRINTLRQQMSDVFVDNHIFVKLHSTPPPN